MSVAKNTTPTTYISLVAHFLDFLTVSVHTILYERGVYPKESFISARKYNYPVRQSRVPEVCEWINKAVDAVEKELLLCAVDKVSLIIYSKYSDPLERFVFDLSKFPYVQKQDWHVPFDSVVNADKKVPVVNMEEQFRGVMSKLAFCHRSLAPMPVDCTFTVAIELKDMADAPLAHPQAWIPVQPSLQREKAQDDMPAYRGEDIGGAQTTPLRTIEAGEMIFEMWIEESKTKIEALDRMPLSDDEDDTEDDTEGATEGDTEGGEQADDAAGDHERDQATTSTDSYLQPTVSDA
jgi:mitotic spindle assembly checkpoint protein MAD2B